jgi:hypothetical protein
MSDSHVYIQDKNEGWLPANVLSMDGDSVVAKVYNVDSNTEPEERTVTLKDYPNSALPLQNVDATGTLLVMPDMVDLPSLHEVSDRS